MDWGGKDWRNEVSKALAEMKRVLHPGGMIILLETQGTGFKTPTALEHLFEYYKMLGEAGFQATWIRTDYRFISIEEGQELAKFFFGDEMVAKIEAGNEIILPECTGLWWMKNF